MQISSLLYIDNINITPNGDFPIGATFDKIKNHEICQKYIVGKDSSKSGIPNRNKVHILKDRIVDGQFKFHFDTDNLRKSIYKIEPTDYISISDKWHGTSAIYSKPLITRKLNFVERMFKNIRIHIQESEYGFVYSSRKVIKCVNGKYETDVWGVVASEIADKIPASYTIYGEIVGYTPQGAAIQSASRGRPYHYGCAKGEHKFVVYRVKTTNIDGKTLELSWPQMREFCTKYGLQMVHEWFYEPISDLFPIETNLYMTIEDAQIRLEKWQNNLLTFLCLEYVNDSMCQFNNNEVPAEGVVIRVDHLDECDSWKLKNFKFLEDETKNNDAGVLDMETVEAEQV